MNNIELEKNYQIKKNEFHNYINNIKKNSKWDIYTIINPTLIKNPYASEFPKNFFFNNTKTKSKTLFVKMLFRYYLKNLYLFFSYLIAFFIYKIYYKKQRKNKLEIIIDTFGLVDKTNENGEFSENYLTGIYKIFEKYNTQYAILLRPYGIGKNPFKLKQFFKIINQNKRDFVFEYEFLKLSNFVKLFGLIAVYPFKILRLLEEEESDIDKIFNSALVEDLKNVNFESFTRYILGRNISKLQTVKTIYSWSEFQVIERSFNYAIRSNTESIELIALQFFLTYETYFNVVVDDLDFEMLSSPHKVLVNGKQYLKDREKVEYNVGVSLRYKDIFNFTGIKEEKYTLVLGSYVENDTKYMLESVSALENIVFKNHPAVDLKKLGQIPKEIKLANENIYKLFETTKIVIATASGTAVEAVACGVSVIIIASQDNLTANPLVEYGKGKIWDIAFSKDDVQILYNKLSEYRKNNKKEISIISLFYRENFFCKLTDKNLRKTFDFK